MRAHVGPGSHWSRQAASGGVWGGGLCAAAGGLLAQSIASFARRAELQMPGALYRLQVALVEGM